MNEEMAFRDMNFKEKLLKLRPYLILLFIPMLFTVLFGELMSPVFVQNIPIAVYDMDNTSKSRIVVDYFYDCPVFNVTENFDSYEAIEDQLLSGKISGAVIILKDFTKDLSAKSGAKAEVLIDGSNFLIGNNLQLYSSTILSTVNAGIQLNLLEAGGMVPEDAEQNVYTLNIADRALYNPQFGYFYYLFAGLLGIFVQQTILAVTPTVLINEKERLRQLPDHSREGLKLRFGSVSYKIGVFAMLNTISMLSCLLIAHKMYAYPINGTLWYVMLIHLVFLLCMFGIALALASVFDDATHCIQFVMFMAVPSFLSCGYGWPEYMMAPGFAHVIKAVWPLYYYVNPMKDLMMKGAGWEVIGHYVIGGLIFAAVWIPLGLLLFNRKLKIIKILH